MVGNQYTTNTGCQLHQHLSPEAVFNTADNGNATLSLSNVVSVAEHQSYSCMKSAIATVRVG
jgi:hypothetical protein